VNKFFVPKDIYEDRMAICKSCTYFQAFRKCKEVLMFYESESFNSSQECPQRDIGVKTTEVEVRTDIPEEIIAEIVLLWEDLKTGRAKDQTAKKKMIEIYNTLYGSNYSTGTNCGSCIAACFDGIKKIYKEYSGNN
jgi:NAD-dependent dihydropyrimidine dehydrogenase PreA subunit